MLVATLPKLRDDLRISQQATPEGPVFILKDPRTERFFRFREAEHFIAEQLDGATPLEVVGRRAEERFGTAVPPESLNGFLDHLRRLGLLEPESTKHQEAVPRRGRVRGDLFYLRLKAYDPDRLFNWLVHKVWFCFTPTFLVSSAGFILFAFGLSLANGQEIGRDLLSLYRVESLLFFWLTIFVTTTLHEFAHGLTCKRFGGEVHELGFLLLYFQPAFYCNVSDAWLFPEKAKRLWVSAAGAYFELCLWALATVVWRVTVAETWPHMTALVVMTTAGVRSFLNMNPLIKLDGYYFLSDALDIPNLRARAFGYLRAMIAHTLFRTSGSAAQVVREATPRERKIYLTYSILAGIFSAWLLGSFASWVGGMLVQRYQGLGFLLFTALLIGVFRHPLKRSLGQTLAWLKTAPMKLASMKLPVRSLALLAAVLAVLFFGRMELKVSGEFKVLPIHNTDIRAEVEGIIQTVHANEGDLVRAGDRIVSLSERDYRAELSKTAAEIEEKRAKLKMLEVGPRREEIALARNAVETARARQAQARALYEELTRLHDERLSMVKTRVEKAEERLKYARKAVERFRELKQAEMVSLKEFEEAEERAAVREKELVEAQVDLKMVLADDLADARHKVMVVAKEWEEAEGRLGVLLAGSRLEEIEATAAEVARLAAAHRHLTEQLRLTEVRSPVSGILTTPKLNERVGQHVNKGDLIAEVHELKTVTAEIAIPEQEIADVQVGQRVVLKARPYPQDSLEGKVAAIAPIATQVDEGPGGKRVLVTTQIDNTALHLKSQMTGTAKIFCGERRIWDLLTRRLARYLRVEFWSWW